MNGWQRRIVQAVSVVIAVVVAYTLLYRWAMFNFEGAERSVFESLQVVIESFTTAGFGGDADQWQTAPTNVLVVMMNLTGVLLVFLALPLFVVPLFQQALEDSPQRSTDLVDHVVICSYNSREDVLRSELDAAGVPYVIIEEDPDTVLELNQDDIEAIYGDPEQEETFENANIREARALVADVSDEGNVSVILTAKGLNEELTVVSVAEDSRDAEYHRYAGADRVIRPRQVLGKALANKATLSLSQGFRESIELSENFELSELLVKEDSELAGKTIGELQLREQIGATVIGMWANGEFVPVPEADMRIDENTILLVAGSHRALEQVNSRSISPKASRDDRIVVAGYGVVGRSAVEALDEKGISRTVVDIEDHDGVDIVGDISDPETLSRCRIEDARFILLALSDDTTSMYMTVALEELAPDTEVIARANDVENTTKLYRGGGEYVLALSTVTGRMLSSALLETEDVLSPDTQFSIVRTTASELVGTTLADADVRTRTGATVVAIERDDALITDPGPDATVREEDTLIIAGSDECVNDFTEQFR
jgi:Trk K+ transport system NAD-binding subunit